MQLRDGPAAVTKQNQTKQISLAIVERERFLRVLPRREGLALFELGSQKTYQRVDCRTFTRDESSQLSNSTKLE